MIKPPQCDYDFKALQQLSYLIQLDLKILS